MRSSIEKYLSFSEFMPIAIIILSNKGSALSIIDLCPIEKGENDPGNTAIFFIPQI